MEDKPIQKLLERLLKESVTVIVLALIVVYFIQREERQEKKFLRIIEEDRMLLKEAIQDKNQRIYKLYDDRIEDLKK
jgi:hypothetical protein